MNLPVLFGPGDLQVIDDHGEPVTVRDASDHALARAAERVAALDRDLYDAKRALAAELRSRYGVGSVDAGGHTFKIVESQSWPVGATRNALADLIGTGKITEADAQRAMPAHPKPDGRALKSLLGRLMVSDPAAAKILADAATVSPPSVRDIRQTAVDGTAA